MSRRVTFWECVVTASRTPTLVAEFDRLTGHHLSGLGKRTPLAAAIDEATGRDAAALAAWLEFIYEDVWCRLPPEVRA